ncbi:MAG: sulfotransferase, partial [Arenimonas sp.]
MSKNINTHIDERIKYIRSLLKAGKPEFAQFEAAKLVAEYPNNVMALCLMTYVFYLVNDLKNALRYSKITLSKITPAASWQEMISASNALLMVGEVEEANAVLQDLDLEKITDTNDLCYIAKHYGSLEQIEMSVKIFKSISDKQLDFHSRQMYGVGLLYLGEFDKARAEFEKAIELNSLDGVSYNQLSVLKIKEGREERIAKMEAILGAQSLDAVNRSYIHFSLFNELDAKNETGLAWEHLQKANTVRRATVHFDAAHDVAGCRNIIQSCRKIQSSAITHEDQSVPIFIVGLPRTGTTLLEKILSSFDEVVPCGELRAFRRELEIAANSNFSSPFGL